MNILLVGGTWTTEPDVYGNYGHTSSLVLSVLSSLKSEHDVTMYNGGNYNDLHKILKLCPEYDVVFWWPNIPDNTLPKIRDVKEIAPEVMLVTSKRNDGDKYSFMELTQHALARKANLVFEFKKTDVEVCPGCSKKLFNIRVFDPLGCQWYGGTDIIQSINAAMKRMEYLISTTRQKTIRSDIDKSLIFSSYTSDEQKFIEIVRKHAETFYEIFNPGKDVKRFLGNASLRAELNIDSTRCMRGMPSFKKGNIIFVSQRNIDKQFISLDNFVPCYMEDGKLFYCGDRKPSVDAPIQLRLYEALPNINYIIHSHCYIEGAPFTSQPIPCGAIEEVDEVLKNIKWVNDLWLNARKYGQDGPNLAPVVYKLNLKGHGSLLMASDVELMRDVKYIARPLPENVCNCDCDED